MDETKLTIQDIQRQCERDGTREDPQEAHDFFVQYLGKELHVHTVDGRIFVGQFKCTDHVSWI